jgi:hypothetical protein
MQRLFHLLIFLIQTYMFRATNSSILRITFWLNIQQLVQWTGRQQCRCTVPIAVYTVKKCSRGWANLSPETCRADLKRLINEKVLASCWLFTSLYQWCAVTQTSTTGCLVWTWQWTSGFHKIRRIPLLSRRLPVLHKQLYSNASIP